MEKINFYISYKTDYQPLQKMAFTLMIIKKYLIERRRITLFAIEHFNSKYCTRPFFEM
jgi:hypothetical protein